MADPNRILDKLKPAIGATIISQAILAAELEEARAALDLAGIREAQLVGALVGAGIDVPAPPQPVDVEPAE